MANKHRRYEKDNQLSCGGKKTYRTYGAALRADRENRRVIGRYINKKRERLHAYRCHSCGLFHLGHIKKNHRKKKSPYKRDRRVR